jgi:hypothetical protein
VRRYRAGPEEARQRGRALIDELLLEGVRTSFVAADRRAAERYIRDLERVQRATGWKRGTWSSGAPCLRKPCGRVASDREIGAVLQTLDRKRPPA